MTSRFQTKKTILGDFAENLVADWLSKKGSVTFSEDPYDDEKDLIFEGKYNIEVKARTVIFRSPIINTFAIEESQWRKLDNPTTQTMFVSIPMHKEDSIKFYYLADRTGYTISSFPNKREKHRFYHIDKMSHVYTITNPLMVEQFLTLNISKYKE